MFPLSFTGISVDKKQRIALKNLKMVGLNQRINHKPNELSGGEQQLVAIARALVNDPEIILADEPLSNVGTEHREIITEVIRGLKEEGKTIVMSAHEIPVEINKLIDRVFIFNESQLNESPRSK